MADLLEHVVVINQGRIVVDAPADELRGRAVTVSGCGVARSMSSPRTGMCCSRQGIGSLASATVAGPLDDLARARAREMNLQIEPVSLQEFVVRTAADSNTHRRGKDERMTRQPSRRVARLHLVDRFSYTWLVWGVLAFTFAVNLAIFAVIPLTPPERQLHRRAGHHLHLHGRHRRAGRDPVPARSR